MGGQTSVSRSSAPEAPRELPNVPQPSVPRAGDKKVWQWNGGRSGWVSYNDAIQAELNQAKSVGKASALISLQGHTYEVNFAAGVQLNLLSGKSRAVRCIAAKDADRSRTFSRRTSLRVSDDPDSKAEKMRSTAEFNKLRYYFGDPTVVPDERIVEVLHVCGGDADLGYHELCKSTAPSLHRDPEGWFNHFDNDKDGELQMEEVIEALECMRDDIDVAVIRSSWSKFDADGGGGVSLEEFTMKGGLKDCLVDHMLNMKQVNGALKSLPAGGHLALFFTANVFSGQDFVKILAERYFQYRRNDINLHVLVVPLDRNNAEAQIWDSTPEWAPVEWDTVLSTDFMVRKRLSEIYEVNKVPALFILNKAGRIINRDAFSDICNDLDGNNYPWADKRLGVQGEEELGDQAKVVELTEAGYQQIASYKSSYAMRIFIKRVIKRKGYAILDEGSLGGLIWEYSGITRVQSLEHLVRDLESADWLKRTVGSTPTATMRTLPVRTLPTSGQSSASSAAGHKLFQAALSLVPEKGSAEAGEDAEEEAPKLSPRDVPKSTTEREPHSSAEPIGAGMVEAASGGSDLVPALTGTGSEVVQRPSEPSKDECRGTGPPTLSEGDVCAPVGMADSDGAGGQVGTAGGDLQGDEAALTPAGRGLLVPGGKGSPGAKGGPPPAGKGIAAPVPAGDKVESGAQEPPSPVGKDSAPLAGKGGGAECGEGRSADEPAPEEKGVPLPGAKGGAPPKGKSPGGKGPSSDGPAPGGKGPSLPGGKVVPQLEGKGTPAPGGKGARLAGGKEEPASEGRGPPQPGEKYPPLPVEKGEPPSEGKGPPTPGVKGPPCGKGETSSAGKGPPAPGGKGPPLPGGKGPPLPGEKGPPLPGGKGPPLPGGKGPPLPGGKGPPLPGGKGETPSGKGPPAPGGKGPVAPGGKGKGKVVPSRPEKDDWLERRHVKLQWRPVVSGQLIKIASDAPPIPYKTFAELGELKIDTDVFKKSFDDGSISDVVERSLKIEKVERDIVLQKEKLWFPIEKGDKRMNLYMLLKQWDKRKDDLIKYLSDFSLKEMTSTFDQHSLYDDFDRLALQIEGFAETNYTVNFPKPAQTFESFEAFCGIRTSLSADGTMVYIVEIGDEGLVPEYNRCEQAKGGNVELIGLDRIVRVAWRKEAEITDTSVEHLMSEVEEWASQADKRTPLAVTLQRSEIGRLLQPRAEEMYLWDPIPEGFCCDLVKIPNVVDRVRAFRIHFQIGKQFLALEAELTQVETIMTAIHGSTALANCFRKLLYIGNCLNAGTENGRADGYDAIKLIEVLLKGYPKGSDKKSLLHHVRDHHMHAEDLQGLLELKKLLEEANLGDIKLDDRQTELAKAGRDGVMVVASYLKSAIEKQKLLLADPAVNPAEEARLQLELKRMLEFQDETKRHELRLSALETAIASLRETLFPELLQLLVHKPEKENALNVGKVFDMIRQFVAEMAVQPPQPRKKKQVKTT